MANTKIFQKRALLPEWIIQFILALLYAVLSGISWAYGYVVYGELPRAYSFTVCVFVLSIVHVITLIAQTTRLIRRTTSPVPLLVVSVLKTVWWAAYWILTLIPAANGVVFILDIILLLIMLIACVVELIVGAVHVHRKRSGAFAADQAYKAEGGY